MGGARMPRCSVSHVRFAAMPDAAIAAYVAGGEPFGKAGAYAIQGAVAAWIAHIDGSHSGIMGLPLYETAVLLRAAARPCRLSPRLIAMANQDILINWAPQETRVAVVENGAVQELHIERTLERGLVGNVYLGKVARVLPGMQSAFIDIGLDRAAFLHVADLNPPANGSGGARGDAAATPIERQIFEGQSLTVQVIKDPIGSKGARLSAQVSIAGRMLVFLPHDSTSASRRRSARPKLREQLRARMQALVGERAGRLHPAHECRRGLGRRTGRRHRLPAQDLGRHPRARAWPRRRARCCTRT